MVPKQRCCSATTPLSKIIKRWIVLVVSFAATILGVVWHERSLRETMMLLVLRQSSSSTNNNSTDDDHPSSTTTEFWEGTRAGESKCFHVDDVCNWKDGWFYHHRGPTNHRGGHRRDREDSHYHQPTVTLLGTMSEDVRMLDWDNLNDFRVDERIRVNISSYNSSSHGGDDDDDRYAEGACSFSPTPYHLVAQSAYNEMMGEFYVRTIAGLNRWMRDYTTRVSEDDIQIYVHFVERYDMFEGHRLFLAGLPNNNMFESLASLMPRDDTCRCFGKLIFCGYLMENMTTFRNDNHSKMMSNDERCSSSFKERVHNKFDSDDPNAIVFKPDLRIPTPPTDCNECRDNAYRELRSDMMKTHSNRYKDLDEKIIRYKRRILVEMGLVSNNTIDAEGGWKFIGFARRKSRRMWLNIDVVMSMCNKKFREYHVACILVDVEEAESPEEQLIMHRSLDALIGIHGAQLTQGVLLPTHGYILELLPWIPSYTGGGWTASTSGPTPLGEMFHNTDINHYGYPLGRESTPLCLHVDISDENGTQSCLQYNQKFNWDVRDFIVPVNAIEDFISTMILQPDATCYERKTRAEGGKFVLYNAFCQHVVNQSTFFTEHYYRPRHR